MRIRLLIAVCVVGRKFVLAKREKVQGLVCCCLTRVAPSHSPNVTAHVIEKS